MNEANDKLRALQDHELEAVSGGEDSCPWYILPCLGVKAGNVIGGALEGLVKSAVDGLRRLIH